MERKSELKETTLRVLQEVPATRGSDPLLVAEVYRRMGYPSDLFEIAKMGGEFKFGSISRYRREAQAVNPLLVAEEETTRNRKATRKRCEKGEYE